MSVWLYLAIIGSALWFYPRTTAVLLGVYALCWTTLAIGGSAPSIVLGTIIVVVAIYGALLGYELALTAWLAVWERSDAWRYARRYARQPRPPRAVPGDPNYDPAPQPIGDAPWSLPSAHDDDAMRPHRDELGGGAAS